jgi:hypothetical protein
MATEKKCESCLQRVKLVKYGRPDWRTGRTNKQWVSASGSPTCPSGSVHRVKGSVR